MLTSLSDLLASRCCGGPEHPDSGFSFLTQQRNCANVRKKMQKTKNQIRQTKKK